MVLITSSEIRWISADEARVSVVYTGGEEGDAYRADYRVRRSATGWDIDLENPRPVIIE